jgi:hypothetical protein
MPLQKPWTPREQASSAGLPGTLGVYELGDSDGEVIYVGYAGGRSPFGLRGRLMAHCSDDEPNVIIRERAAAFRYEVTTNYLVRHLDLLSRFHADHGGLPSGNEPEAGRLPALARYAAKGARRSGSE